MKTTYWTTGRTDPVSLTNDFGRNFEKQTRTNVKFKKNTKKNTWREKLDLLTCSWMKFRFCYVIDATNERIPYTKLKKGGDGKLGWKRNVDRVIFLYDTGIDNFLPFEEDERNFVFTRRRRMNWLSVSRSRGPLLFYLLFYVFYYRNCCCIEDLCCCCCISCSSHQKEDNFFIFFFFVL